MGKERPTFLDDLRTIQGEVEADVGTILEIAKKEQPLGARSPRQPTEAGPSIKKRQRSADGHAHSAVRSPIASKPALRAFQNVTTRLSEETNLLLTEAALRQRLGKQVPATRQDIVETAVRDWLRRHGYEDDSTS